MKEPVAALFALALAGCEAEPSSSFGTGYHDADNFADTSPLSGGSRNTLSRPPALERQAAPSKTDAVPLTYRGYACLEDCSGHEAGYEWAEEQGVTDPDECSGNSDSFIEGCIAYAEEQQSSEGEEGEVPETEEL